MFTVLLSLYYKEAPQYLRQSLDSIFTQKLLADEVVLVKDGPLTEELNEIIVSYACRYPFLKIVSFSKNQGLGKALNEGLKHCSHDIVARMDTDDIATAKKVWRWNKGGLGYSSTGYNGPFALAMTQDGQIVADFVKTGTMSANRINGGTLILGGKNNSNGTALIKDSYGKVLIRLDRDGITLSEDVQISYENISDAPSIPTKVSELTNDSKYTTMPDVEKKGYQTKANVTKITKDTVTTTYVNALDITAKQVNCKSGSKEANINAGASHYKYSNEYIGEIGTNSWTGNDNRRGLVFDLDENGDYMTWAAQPKSGQSYLVKLLYERNGYTSNTVTYNADTINLGCDVDMHYYKLKNVSWENGSGITGTMRFVQVGGMNSDGTASNWSNNAYLQFERGVLVKAGWHDY